MAETRIVTIGGQAYWLPTTITLGTIKAFNPALKELKATAKTADAVDIAVIAAKIVGAALLPAYPAVTPEMIETNTLASEISGLRDAMWEVLIASGLYVRAEQSPGEAKPGEIPAATSQT